MGAVRPTAAVLYPTSRVWMLGLCFLISGCGSCGTPITPPPRTNQPDIIWCPGSNGCLRTGPQQIRAGAGKRTVTPQFFEIANPNYLSVTQCDPLMTTRFGAGRCGELRESPRDCGTDGLCSRDTGYPGADADGTEGDGRQDWFRDCGTDRICLGNIPEQDDTTTTGIREDLDGLDNDGDGAVDDGPYQSPDANGTEGDGLFTAAWIAGFGNSRPAMGVHDPVEARCLALNTADTTVVLCGLDAVGLFREEVERARVLFKERHRELDLDYLAVMSSHTHESVDTLGQWGYADPYPAYTGRLAGHNAFVVQGIVDAAAAAVESLQPARLQMTSANTGREGFLRDSRDPKVFLDAMVLVEAVTQETGQPIFTVVNWGNHPEVLSSDNSFISSDYPFALRRAIENGLPATSVKPALPGRGGMAIYFNGTVGGLMTPLGIDLTDRNGVLHPADNQTFARMEAYGENLAEIALKQLQDASAAGTLVTTEKAELKVKAEEFFIPVKNRLFILAFAAGLFDRLVYDDAGEPIDPEVTSLLEVPGGARTEVFTVELGPWSMVGVPGELFPEAAVGGYDGSRTLGLPLIAEDHCPDPASCAAEDERLGCPEVRPPEGWDDCRCEACRLCVLPSMTSAPQGPYMLDRLPGRFKMLLGLANDELGYLVPAYAWQVSEKDPFFCQAEDHYEETNSTGEFAMPRIDEALGKLFDFAL